MLRNFQVIQCLLVIIFYNFVLADNETLKLINVVFRHGDRTPVIPYELYPKDPYINYNFSFRGYSTLTNSGEMRVYKLGQVLRNAYNEFLENNYRPGFVEARSTDVNRTKESLNILLKALYPEFEIPIMYEPVENDPLLLPQACPEYLKEYINATIMSNLKQELLKLEDFMKNLSQWTGKTIKSARDILFIYTTLENEKFMNLTLPSWTQGVFPDGDLLNGSIIEYNIMNYNQRMIRRTGGMLIRKFMDDMNCIRCGLMDKNRKIMLYSAHDITVVAVLKALGVYYPHVPKFSSAVIVELHLINQVYYVKVSYYLGAPAEIKELQIPGCEILCPLDQFMNLMQNVTACDSDFSCSKVENSIGVGIISKQISNMIKNFKVIFS